MSDMADSCQLGVTVSDTSPMRFLASGRLVNLRIGDRDLLRETADYSGFYLAWFDGTGIREIPLPHVTQRGDRRIQVVAETAFPRLIFSVSDADGRLEVILQRVEGMPAEHDVSIAFRAGLNRSCTAMAIGEGVIVTQPTPDALTAYWTESGGGRRGADYGGFVLTPGRSNSSAHGTAPEPQSLS